MEKRTRTVYRSAKSGRFVKKTAAKYNPSVTVKESIQSDKQPTEVARSASTGRFVKKSTAKRHPATTVVESVKR